MLYVSGFAAPAPHCMLLRFTSENARREATALPWMQGWRCVECTTPEAATRMLDQGCRVALVAIEHEADLFQLDRYEDFIDSGRIACVGLIARELIGLPRMREFIARHLFNFLLLPAAPDQLLLTLRHAAGMAALRDSLPPSAAPATAARETGLHGSSVFMQRLLRQMQKAAQGDAPVLITGPAGAGKTHAARGIHLLSPRAQAPFVVFDPVVPAAQQLAAATGGTLLLDAADGLSPASQAQLTGILLTGLPPTGAAGARIIVTSRTDLEATVREGRFREDLYLRLGVVQLQVPPLADRGQDIEDIASDCFQRIALVQNRSLRGFSKAAMEALLNHRWPGNVRELLHRVQRAIVLAEGRFIQPGDLGLEQVATQAAAMSLEQARAAAESETIRRALTQSRNQISRAASLLGVSRVTLYRLIKKYDIRTELAVAPRTGAHGR